MPDHLLHLPHQANWQVRCAGGSTLTHRNLDDRHAHKLAQDQILQVVVPLNTAARPVAFDRDHLPILPFVVGLPGACASLDDDAAQQMVESIDHVQESLNILNRPDQAP